MRIEGLGQRPFLGWGHGNHRQAMPPTSELVQGLSERKERTYGDRPTKRLSSHNTFLVIAHDGGLPALGFFLLAVTSALWGFWKRRGRWRSEEIALVASLGAALFARIFYSTMYGVLWPFFLFVLGCLHGETRREPPGG